MIGRMDGMAVRFRPAGITVGFQGKEAGEFQLEFEGALARVPSGSELLKSYTNYLVGSDPVLWRTHVPNYGRVTYRGLYPGIDAVFYGSGHELEHDFVVSRGADYRQIRMHLSENARASLGKDGALSIAFKNGSVQMHRPFIYQEVDGKRQQKVGSFRVLANGEIGFTVAGYDPRYTLVIDPVLSFSTYLSPQAPDANLIATDNNGNSYISGYATFGYPVTSDAFAGCPNCTTNNVVTFVSKLTADGTSLIYSTVLGGNNFAQPTGIGVDANGNVVVSGWTGATDFPTKSGQPIATQNGVDVGFLVSLSADGSSLNYSTLLGSSPSSGLSTMTYAAAVAVDSYGNAYVTGNTGNGFSTTPGALNQGGGGNFGNQFNVFLAKFSPVGTLLYSAVLGAADPQNGGGGPIGASAIAVDAAGDAYVAGQAGTLWPISSQAYLKQIAGSMPYATPFVTKVAPDAKTLVYSTYLDYAYVVTGIAALPSGNVFVTGDSVGGSYPTTPNAYEKNSGGGGAFLAELDPNGSSLVYSTVVGDSYYRINGLALDPDGNIWLAGQTSNPQFPLVTPLQSIFPKTQGIGLSDLVSVVSEFDPTGQTLKFSTFLGGVAHGYASSVAVDGNRRTHVAGAAGYGMYTTPGVYAGEVPAPGGAIYAYVALVDPSVPAPALCATPNTELNFGTVGVGTFADRTVTVTSCGTQPLTITGTSVAAGVFTIPASGNACTQTLPVGQSCALRIRYTPTAVDTDSSNLTIESNASIPEAVLPVVGNGAVPVIVVSNTTAFDYTIVGQTSAPKMVLIQNRSQVPLVLDPRNTTISGDFSLQGFGSCAQPISGACALPVYFTPTASGLRTGTLSIASNDPAHPTVTVQLQAVGYAHAPVPQITSLTSQLVQAGVAETNFSVLGYGFLPSSIVEVNGVPQQTTYENSNFLSVTLAASSIPANSYGELAVTVVTPAPGGGTSVPYMLTEFQVVSTANSFMIFEPVSKQLFISTPASATNNPNTILPINPADVTTGAPIPVGNDPGVLAASVDGKYLYVALNTDHAIQRINLATNAIERTFALPVDAAFGNLKVFDMHVVPDTDTEVVASLFANANPSEDGVAFFDDSGLVNWIPGLPQQNRGQTVSVDRFAFTSDPTTLYADTPFSSGFAELTYSSAGLQYSGKSCCVASNGTSNNGSLLASDGTLLYTDTGVVWNPASNGQIVGTYSIPNPSHMDSVVPDTSSGKTYFLNLFGEYSQGLATTVLSFDAASLSQAGALSLTANTGAPSPTGTQLVRWGTNGFAFRALQPGNTTASSVFLFTSSIASAGNLNPVPVASTLAPASTAATGPDFVLTVNGSSFIPGSTVEWNGSPRLTTVVSPTQVTAIIYASDIAAAGTAQVVVMNPGQATASAPLSFTIGAQLPSAPSATLSPASLTFASQAVGTSSSPQTVTLTDSGKADLTGITIALTGANAGSFSQTSNCGTTLNAGTSCSISVVFSPASAGTASANLTVADNASPSPQSVALSGTALVPAPTATLSPTSLAFALQAVSTSSSAQVVTLTNAGNADLTAITIAVTGANPGSFSQTSNCGTTLNAGRSCSISVVFSPTSAGDVSANLAVADNASTSPQSVALSGTTQQNSFLIGPPTGGSTSSTVAAGQPATYSLSITTANGYSGTLSFACNNLPANASCSFTPPSLALEGGKSATLSLTISTKSTQAAALRHNPGLVSLLSGIVFLLPLSKKRAHTTTLTVLFLLLFVAGIGMSACGGGSSSSGSSVTPQQPTVVPGTYTIQLVASDGTTKQTQQLTLVVQ